MARDYAVTLKYGKCVKGQTKTLKWLESVPKVAHYITQSYLTQMT